MSGYAPGMPRIALLSTSDTDLLSARASGADYVLANPARAGHTELAGVLEGCDLIVARILGSPQMLCSGFDRFRGTGKPIVVLGGEQAPDAALMELSTVPTRSRCRCARLSCPGRTGQPQPTACFSVGHGAVDRYRL